MENNYFKLKFNNTITRLAGYDYGQEVFKNQIAKKIDYQNTPIIIEFPDQIIRAASSFTQGFFEELKNRFGYNLIDNQVIIRSINQSLIDSIKINLMWGLYGYSCIYSIYYFVDC